MVVGENGILNRATDAKQKTDLAKEKENLDFSITSAFTPESLYSEFTLDSLQTSLNSHFGNNEATAIENPDGSFTVKIKESGNEYQLTKTGQEINVNKVKDKNPAVLSGIGSQEDPFLIESIEDLIFFSYQVREGIENYEGKYVELATDLNFASSDSYVDPNCEDYSQYGYTGKIKEEIDKNGFIPIGTSDVDTSLNVEQDTKCFKGIFNGNNKQLINLKIKNNVDSKKIYIGFFTKNRGEINNLKIIMNTNFSISDEEWSGAGILNGINYGIIKNCSVDGNIVIEASGYAFNLGGLCGGSYGKIINCCNLSNIEINGNLSNDCRVGGICGSVSVPGELYNCYNSGNISFYCECVTHVGGIVGNFGTNKEIAPLHNIYNIGVITEKSNKVRNILDEIFGNNYRLSESDLFDNSTWFALDNLIKTNYKESVLLKNSNIKSQQELKGQAGVTLLNKDNDDQVWVEDINNINNGYPILNWQAEN